MSKKEDKISNKVEKKGMGFMWIIQNSWGLVEFSWHPSGHANPELHTYFNK